MKKYLLLILLSTMVLFTKAQTSITMQPFSGNLCAGQTFWVHMTSTGTFPANNYFIVECSDIFGNYYGLWLSSPTYGSPDSILCTIYPPYFPQTEGGYRIRILNTGSTVNADSSNDNGTSLTIYAQPAAPTLTVSGNACVGMDSITASGASAGSQFIWALSNDSVYQSLYPSYIPPAAGSYTATYVTAAADGSCTSSVSNSVTINTNQASVSISVAGSVCHGDAITYIATPTNGGSNPTYQWFENNNPVGVDSASYTNSNAFNNTSIQVEMFSNAVCVSGHNVFDVINAAVYPVPAVPLLTTTGHGCLGADSLTLAAGGPYGLTWYYNGNSFDSADRAYIVAGGNGQGAAANQFSTPFGIYVDASGALYVADAFNARIQKFPAGSTSMTNGVTVAANGLSTPFSVFIDAAGYLYVSDVDYDVVLKYPPGSDSTTVGVVVAGDPNSYNYTAANVLSSPVSIYVDPTGNLYVGDDGNNRVQKFPPGSDSLTNAVTVAKNQIGGINTIWVDHAGQVYVADYVNNWVWKFPAGADSATAGNIVAKHGLGSPAGITKGNNNDLYVGDGTSSVVLRYPQGSDSATAGVIVAGSTPGTGPFQIIYPIYIFVDSLNDIYVSDAGNIRVQKWLPEVDTTYLPIATGSYTATYVSTYGCKSALSDTIVVSAPPQVSLSLESLVAAHDLTLFSGPDTIWCDALDPSIFSLQGGTPIGGIYSGAFVNNDTINFTSSNIGPDRQDTLYYTYTNAAGCSATTIDSFLLTVCEGVQEVPGQNAISLYPNPNTGSFVLETIDAIGQQYTITDMLGRVVAQGDINFSSQAVEAKGITAGTYILQVSGSSAKAVRFTVGQ
jgi:sugar lactone lactonase YvrE